MLEVPRQRIDRSRTAALVDRAGWLWRRRKEVRRQGSFRFDGHEAVLRNSQRIAFTGNVVALIEQGYLVAEFVGHICLPYRAGRSDPPWLHIQDGIVRARLTSAILRISRHCRQHGSALAAGRFRGNLGSAGNTQFAHDVADMSLDGPGREIQLRGDLPGGHCCRDQAYDVHLGVKADRDRSCTTPGGGAARVVPELVRTGRVAGDPHSTWPQGVTERAAVRLDRTWIRTRR